jgi:type I restriction enzyme, S subunit
MESIEKLILEEKKKINWTTKNISEIIIRGNRLDATNYSSEGEEFRKIVKNYDGNIKQIKSIIDKIFVPPPIKRIFTDDENVGTPYLAPSDLHQTIVKSEKGIIEHEMKDIQDWFVKEKWLLITQSGLVGIPIIARKKLEKFIISQNMIRVIFKNNEDVNFLYILFKTKIGHKLLSTNFYGSVVTHIEPEHVEELTIPYPSTVIRKKISEQVDISLKFRDEADILFEKAQKTLAKHTGINDLKQLKPSYLESSQDRYFSLSKIQLKNRFDATFHDPIITKIIDQLKKTKLELTTIDDPRISKEIFLPGRFKRIFVKEEFGIPFLGGRNIVQFVPQQLKYLSKELHKELISNDVSIKENMILITRSGTIGRVLLTPKHFEGYTATEDIIRISPSGEIHSGYIYAFLSSDFGKKLITRNTFGSVVGHIDTKNIASIPILLLKKNIIDEIGDMIFEAFSKLTRAYNLEKKLVCELEEHISKKQKK